MLNSIVAFCLKKKERQGVRDSLISIKTLTEIQTQNVISRCLFPYIFSVGFENSLHGEPTARNCWPVLFFSSPPSARMCIRFCTEKSVFNHKGKLKPPVVEQWESLFSIAEKFLESFFFSSGGCFSTWFSSTPSLTPLNWIALKVFLMR